MRKLGLPALMAALMGACGGNDDAGSGLDATLDADGSEVSGDTTIADGLEVSDTSAPDAVSDTQSDTAGPGDTAVPDGSDTQ
ncbi:MAG TPA: hypothetical protein PK095_17660, partial [Myxococcota bacterium]|nr:hypothetical protein [Myxococcota bacterium]